jgi:hypothetical protein
VNSAVKPASQRPQATRHARRLLTTLKFFVSSARDELNAMAQTVISVLCAELMSDVF